MTQRRNVSSRRPEQPVQEEPELQPFLLRAFYMNRHGSQVIAITHIHEDGKLDYEILFETGDANKLSRVRPQYLYEQGFERIE